MMMKKVKQSWVFEQRDEGKTTMKKANHNEKGRTTKEGKARKKGREKKMEK
jgi:hypothetical protein